VTTGGGGIGGEGGDALLLNLLFKARTKRTGERKRKEGKRFASWGPGRLFGGIHYLARLKIHQRLLPPFQHKFHSIRLSAARPDLRSCLICCTSR